VTFATASVANLIFNILCLVLRLLLGASILAHVFIKCSQKDFVALSKGPDLFSRNRNIRFVKPDYPVLTDLSFCFLSWTCSNLVTFIFASKVSSLR
jgi:hypothetical protein